jgi:ACS family tartrate transporter-like MFS transporter
MGSLAGWLLNLNGRLGLTGWQWLFLVEGIPAALYSLVIWFCLPDGPKEARWLTSTEKGCLLRQLDQDSGSAHLGHSAGVLQSLLSPKVWMIGMFFFCVLTCSYAYQLSAPAILQEATGWSVSRVGAVIALLGLAGGAGMLLNGIHSDRSGERSLHCIVPCLVMAVGFLLAGNAHAGWATVTGLGASFIAIYSLLGPAVALPTEFLAGKAAAAGIAAMNTITMFSGFVGPYWVGVMRDATGNYEGAIRALVVPSLAAAGIMFFLTRSLARSRASGFRSAELARKSA